MITFPHIKQPYIGQTIYKTAIERQRDKETKKQRSKEAKKKRNKETNGQRNKETMKQRDTETMLLKEKKKNNPLQNLKKAYMFCLSFLQ